MREEEKLARLRHIVDRFENSVKILVELESMKVENEVRRNNNESLAYDEQAFLNLIKDI